MCSVSCFSFVYCHFFAHCYWCDFHSNSATGYFGRAVFIGYDDPRGRQRDVLLQSHRSSNAESYLAAGRRESALSAAQRIGRAKRWVALNRDNHPSLNSAVPMCGCQERKLPAEDPLQSIVCLGVGVCVCERRRIVAIGGEEINLARLMIRSEFIPVNKYCQCSLKCSKYAH